MIELLALPGWDAPPRPLEEWAAQLSARGLEVVVTRESTGVAWLEVGSLRLRGYVVLQGGHVDAVNFELGEPDPARAARVVEDAAAARGWEVHPDDPDDDEDDDE